ncbi:MAG: GntR family transcriptional regulator [Pseudomonas sp.]|nr:GntR family transcriptional regulator [Pseudomonas sp.]
MQLINVSPPSQRSCVASTIDATRAQISDRTWKSGDRLPSESALVEQFGGARYTVRDALRFLVNWR